MSGSAAMAIRGVSSRRLMLLIAALSCLGCRGKGCLDEERRALLEIKKVINYPNGSALQSWGQLATREGKDCCLWEAITCDSVSGRVVEIDLIGARQSPVEETWRSNLTMLAEFSHLRSLNLASNHMGGTLPNVICNLKLLESLDLSANMLEGSVPSCLCSLRSLKSLDLSSNTLQGDMPSCFGRSHSLRSLNLLSNPLQGNYSSWLCDMRSLTELYLSNEKFPTSIPQCLGRLNKLRYLQLEGDGFKGSIPPSIFSNLTDLGNLEIKCDGLEGTLQFAAFSNLSKLEYITISSKSWLQIDTEYPASWVPSFQLLSLEIFGASVNKNRGNILPSFLSTQTELRELFFVGTSISGTPPLGLLCNSSLSSLVLRNNRLSGPFLLPCRNASESVSRVDLSFNLVRGSLPENIGLSIPKLDILNLAGNELEGRIPESLGRAPLYLLDLSDNSVSGMLPHTLTRNQTSLSLLNVSLNRLEGEMLPADASMPALGFLIVNDNNFTGSLLSRLSNSSRLSIIIAGYNSFADDFSLSQPYFPYMSLLSLRQNRVHGVLPARFCQMQYLRFLDLSGNNLSGGVLPCLNNISLWRSRTPGKGIIWIDSRAMDASMYFVSKNSGYSFQGTPLLEMTILDLSLNMIGGLIPLAIGELKGLNALNLSNNRIQGPIPVALTAMDSVESLDLSHNRLSGSIPQEMSRLSFLSGFSVAFNDLSGPIPAGAQLATFPRSSFEGNLGLCGLPLGRTCSPNENDATKTAVGGEDEGKSKGPDDAVFYSLVSVSFVLGFWGFVGSFFLSRIRGKGFKIIDDYYNNHLRGV